MSDTSTRWGVWCNKPQGMSGWVMLNDDMLVVDKEEHATAIRDDLRTRRTDATYEVRRYPAPTPPAPITDLTQSEIATHQAEQLAAPAPATWFPMAAWNPNTLKWEQAKVEGEYAVEPYQNGFQVTCGVRFVVAIDNAAAASLVAMELNTLAAENKRLREALEDLLSAVNAVLSTNAAMNTGGGSRWATTHAHNIGALTKERDAALTALAGGPP